MKDAKYVIIGGQYEPQYYGTCRTLRGAKWKQTHYKEYWDNWQGWHKPKIYRIEDTEEIETKGWITYRDGCLVRVPKPDAYSVDI